MAGGRPTNYNEVVADNIIQLLTQGYSVHEICSADGMPSEVTFYTWVRKHPEFLQKYREGRDAQTDALMDRIVMACNMLVRGEGDASAFNVAIRGYEIAAKRMSPRKYGDKSDVNLGGQADNPVVMALTWQDK
jgi:hypothetical protein